MRAYDYMARATVKSKRARRRAKVRRPKLPGIGEFDSGRTDTSARAHEILFRAAKRGGWS